MKRINAKKNFDNGGNYREGNQFSPLMGLAFYIHEILILAFGQGMYMCE